MQKTNVMRKLDSAKISYTAHEYDISDGVLDAVSVSSKLGANSEIVFKTLVTQAENRGVFVFVIPGQDELDLKAAAKAAGKKRLEMLAQKDLLAKTGYIHGGCSPIGMKKKYTTFIDAAALEHSLIYVSAGRPGVNLSLDPKQLADYIGAKFEKLRKEKA